MNKIERIQERASRFINNDYHSDYSTLLSKNEHVTMEVKQMRFLCTEIYKTLNGLNPNYMNKIFVKSCSRYSSRRPHDLMVPRVNQTKFGLKSIQYEGAKLWNHLSNSIKSAENLEIFKKTYKKLARPDMQMPLMQTIIKSYHLILMPSKFQQINSNFKKSILISWKATFAIDYK